MSVFRYNNTRYDRLSQAPGGTPDFSVLKKSSDVVTPASSPSATISSNVWI